MKGLFRKYWLFILVGFIFLMALTMLLVIVTSRPQEGGFVYQID